MVSMYIISCMMSYSENKDFKKKKQNQTPSYLIIFDIAYSTITIVSKDLWISIAVT